MRDLEKVKVVCPWNSLVQVVYNSVEAKERLKKEGLCSEGDVTKLSVVMVSDGDAKCDDVMFTKAIML